MGASKVRNGVDFFFFCEFQVSPQATSLLPEPNPFPHCFQRDWWSRINKNKQQTKLWFLLDKDDHPDGEHARPKVKRRDGLVVLSGYIGQYKSASREFLSRFSGFFWWLCGTLLESGSRKLQSQFSIAYKGVARCRGCNFRDLIIIL